MGDDVAALGAEALPDADAKAVDDDAEEALCTGVEAMALDIGAAEGVPLVDVDA